MPIKQLLIRVKEINSKGGCVIQVFEPEKVVNRTHLVAAYLNALLAFSSKSNVANSVAVEMVLYAALTRQISDAIKTMGARSTKEMVIFADSKATYARIKPLLSKDSDFSPSKAHMERAAKLLGIKVDLGDLSIMQEIAVSRLGQ